MSTLLRVAELNAAYAATIDADKLEAWPDFFVESCVYKITSAENRKCGYSAGIVYADSRAMLHDRVTALRTANIVACVKFSKLVMAPGCQLIQVNSNIPLFDWQHHPFVPTWPLVERRAQRQSRMGAANAAAPAWPARSVLDRASTALGYGVAGQAARRSASFLCSRRSSMLR